MPMPWQVGDITETGFLFRSTEEGFQTSTPYGGRCRYDAVLDSGYARWRIQAKSASGRTRKNTYRVRITRNARVRTGRHPKAVPYTEDEIDFVVIHLVPEKTWYIFPIAVLKGQKTVNLYSPRHKKQGKWGKYREAWDLLRQPAPCTCGRELWQKKTGGDA